MKILGASYDACFTDEVERGVVIVSLETPDFALSTVQMAMSSITGSMGVPVHHLGSMDSKTSDMVRLSCDISTNESPDTVESGFVYLGGYGERFTVSKADHVAAVLVD